MENKSFPSTAKLYTGLEFVVSSSFSTLFALFCHGNLIGDGKCVRCARFVVFESLFSSLSFLSRNRRLRSDSSVSQFATTARPIRERRRLASLRHGDLAKKTRKTAYIDVYVDTVELCDPGRSSIARISRSIAVRYLILLSRQKGSSLI